MTEYIVAAVVGVIELGLIIYKYYVNTIGRNPVCGGIIGFGPWCPITGAYTQVYQGLGDSCLVSTACRPGLACVSGTCQDPNSPTQTGRRSVFPDSNGNDRAQWCAIDSDCQGFVFVNPLDDGVQQTALCVNGKCRPADVRYGSISTASCNIVSCPIGTCICINSSDRMIQGYENIARKYGRPLPRPYPVRIAFSIPHAPLGVSSESITNSAIGFNSEQLPPTTPNMNKIWARFVVCLVLLGISILTLVMSITATGKMKVILIGLTIILQVLLIVFLLSKWK